MIDINSDLGESYGAWLMGDDASMLNIVSSANIACGFHAGSPAGILQTLTAAKERGVSVGAHVSYPDLVGFGRRSMDIASDDLTADVIYQIGALQGLAKAAGTEITHVKPHGALYNTIAHHEQQAKAVIKAILDVDRSLVLVALAGSTLIEWATDQGLKVVSEAFADRSYTPQGQLVSRQHPHAVLHDINEICHRMLQLIQHGTITAIDGSTITLHAQSICVHGDSPGAVAIAQNLKSQLIAAGIEIKPFAAKRTV